MSKGKNKDDDTISIVDFFVLCSMLTRDVAWEVMKCWLARSCISCPFGGEGRESRFGSGRSFVLGWLKQVKKGYGRGIYSCIAENVEIAVCCVSFGLKSREFGGKIIKKQVARPCPTSCTKTAA